jgi:site-specific recombinase XerD
MKRATFTILFYLKRKKKEDDGHIPIYARVTVNGQRAEFSLNKSITKEEWSQQKGCVQGNTRPAKQMNAYLQLIRNKLYSYKVLLEQDGKDATAKALRNSYHGIDDNPRTILNIFAEHNDRCKSLINIDFAKGTWDRYDTCYRHIQRFMWFKYKKNDLSLSEISPIFIRDFEHYLKTERNCRHNTTTKYIKNFKKIIRIALTNGWLKVDPFANIKFRLEEVDLDFLNEEELNTIMLRHFPIARIQQVKDIYIFCCFTGLSFIDIKTLVYSEIELIENTYWIKKRRQKTKNMCHIPLLKPAVLLMNKYKEHPECQRKGTVLPVLSNQKMNAYLKEIADICGINKKLSTHTARHTFATTVTLANHISIEVVSKMLGHSSINMTKKYARVVDDLISRDMMKIQHIYNRVSVT